TSQDVNGNGIPDEVESCLPPVLDSEPQSQIVQQGASVTLSVAAHGTAPLAYIWTCNGSPLSNDPNISGATTANLTIDSVTATSTGNYSVTVSNLCGSLVTTPANISIAPPVLPVL